MNRLPIQRLCLQPGRLYSCVGRSPGDFREAKAKETRIDRAAIGKCDPGLAVHILRAFVASVVQLNCRAALSTSRNACRQTADLSALPWDASGASFWRGGFEQGPARRPGAGRQRAVTRPAVRVDGGKEFVSLVQRGLRPE